MFEFPGGPALQRMTGASEGAEDEEQMKSLPPLLLIPCPQVPENDTVVPHYHKRFRTCAAVGNSGGLKLSKAGPAIDSHDAVLRYNGAPSSGFEDISGVKTTFRLLNRRIGDALLSQPAPTDRLCTSTPPPPPPFPPSFLSPLCLLLLRASVAVSSPHILDGLAPCLQFNMSGAV